MTTTRRYTCEVTLLATIRVEAESAEDAARLVKEALDGADANLGCWLNGDPILATVDLEGDPDVEEDPQRCRTCQEPLDLDGYDGECGNCADKAAADDEDEDGDDDGERTGCDECGDSWNVTEGGTEETCGRCVRRRARREA